MQILVVKNNEERRSRVETLEQAKRIERTNPGKHSYFQLVFGPRSTKPTLKKVSVAVSKNKRPVYTVTDDAGNEITE